MTHTPTAEKPSSSPVDRSRRLAELLTHCPLNDTLNIDRWLEERLRRVPEAERAATLREDVREIDAHLDALQKDADALRAEERRNARPRAEDEYYQPLSKADALQETVYGLAAYRSRALDHLEPWRAKLRDVNLVRVNLGWCLVFRLTPAATRDFYRMSVAAQGRRLVLTLNGQPAGARRLDQAISDGGLMTFVEVMDADLPVLADRIRRTSVTLAKHANQ